MSKIITHANKKNNEISECKVDGKSMTKTQIIEDIEKNKEIYKTKDNNGPVVNVIKHKWLRTDNNGTESDNLGNLDTF